MAWRKSLNPDQESTRNQQKIASGEDVKDNVLEMLVLKKKTCVGSQVTKKSLVISTNTDKRKSGNL